MVIIKKYPNRRLYDTSQSQYVNLDYIRELVMNHSEFKVVDSKTDEDLTKIILLQIITDQEGNEQQALLTNQVLKQLIRYYGSDMQMFLRMYLEQSMASFLERQDAMQGMMKNIIEASPVGVFNQMLGKNMDFWKHLSDVGGPGFVDDDNPKNDREE